MGRRCRGNCCDKNRLTRHCQAGVTSQFRRNRTQVTRQTEDFSNCDCCLIAIANRRQSETFPNAAFSSIVCFEFSRIVLVGCEFWPKSQVASERCGRAKRVIASAHLLVSALVIVEVTVSQSIGRFLLLAVLSAMLAACGGDSAPASTTKPQPAVNQPPSISGSPPTSVVAQTEYVFQPTASDPEGAALTFAIANKPAWAAFNAQTGMLRGTPTSANVGNFANVTINVSDGTNVQNLVPFSIQVLSAPVANRAPTISGTPSLSVTVPNAYSFQPTGADPDGNALTFSITNKPSWATFNASTGALSGTPAASNVGTFSNVTISVSDGALTASLAAFSIQVNPAPPVASNSATLSWTAPIQRTDGSALTGLSGFKIYYGQISRSYSQTQTVAGGTATSAIVQNLAAGTWFFALSAIDSAGAESSQSAEVSRTF